MEKERIERVKKDLRELKKHVHLINTLLRRKAQYLLRIDTLRKSHRIKAREEIEMIEEVLAQMNIEKYIERATNLEKKYMTKIKKLSITDQAIIIDYYINGLPAWKIGLRLDYSEDGIRKRLQKALEKIA